VNYEIIFKNTVMLWHDMVTTLKLV